MNKKRILLLTILTIMMTVFSNTLVFATSNSALGDWASSYSLQGTTDVYYNAPWLVGFVQFLISWLCIIAFLCYYMSYLCSLVVLSNKQLFYLIDTLKRDKNDSTGRKSMFGSVIEAFKTGQSGDGVNGGADNIIIFFLMLSVNFKAFSVYKDVQVGDDGESDGKGPNFSYSDTMASFFLKTLFNSIFITFILSIALSGLLIRVWFTVGDVLIVKADRFANTNLTAKLDEILGNDGKYTSSLKQINTKGGQLSAEVFQRLFANVYALFPEISEEHTKLIGIAVEDAIWSDTGAATGAATSVLDGDTKGYASFYNLIKNNLSDPANFTESTLSSEEAMGSVYLSDFVVNASDDTYQDSQLVFSIDKILENAGIEPPKGPTGLYAHVTFLYNEKTSNNYTEKKN